MIRVDCKQGEKEWFDLKLGVPSASHFKEIITSKGEKSKSGIKYMRQLAGETITRRSKEAYSSQAMKDGIENEPEAVALFEFVTDLETEEVGVCYLNEDKSVLVSPDRIIKGSSEGVLEVKCLEAPAHIEYLLGGKLPAAYFQQVQGQLYVTGFSYAYFMSHHRGLKPLILRVERDEVFISQLKFELDLFVAELKIMVDKLRRV